MRRRSTGGLALVAAAAIAIAALAGLAAGSGGGQKDVDLSVLGTFATGKFSDDDLSGAEIPAYDARTKRVFVVNGKDDVVDVLDIRDPERPVEVGTGLDVAPGRPNSVAVRHGLVAVAVEDAVKTNPGTVQFFSARSLRFLGSVEVGALPDMLTFTPDGRTILVANEGEPSADYSVDPEGSVSVIDLRHDKRHHDVSRARVRTAGFHRFTPADLPGVRIFGLNNPTVAQDLEPEYIAVSEDSETAWVTIQEGDAIAKVDVSRGRVTSIKALGTKDHSLPGNGLDPSDRDGPSNGPAVKIGNWPVHGLYMPDAIAAVEFRHKTYLLTANEGDARAFGTLVEEARVNSLTLDPTVFPNAATLKQNANLGRLTVSNIGADTDADGDVDVLNVFGARSVSVWTADVHQVWDSGDQFEQLTAVPGQFNASHDDNASWDSRSDNKGPEPEGIAVGEIDGRTYAFIAFERIGGVAVYDVTDPRSPVFKTYLNNRNFAVPAKLGTGISNPAALDLGPEGLAFIPKAKSPTHEPLLVVANEISGTTTVFAIDLTRP
jgi:DNA-binding beta-propeller fold protein YncE